MPRVRSQEGTLMTAQPLPLCRFCGGAVFFEPETGAVRASMRLLSGDVEYRGEYSCIACGRAPLVVLPLERVHGAALK